MAEFRTLQKDSKVYVVVNQGIPVFHEAIVESVSPEVANATDYALNNYAPITIKTKSGENTFSFSHINSNHSFAKTPLDGDKNEMLIATDKKQLIDYVKKIGDYAKEQLSMMDKFKAQEEASNEIILAHGGESFASEIKIKKMESGMTKLEEKQDEILELLHSMNPKKQEEKEEQNV